MNIINHFIDTMKTVLVTRATDFNGRSNRPEFWYFTLYGTIVAGLLMVVDKFVFGFTFFSMLEPFSGNNDSGVLVMLFLFLLVLRYHQIPLIVVLYLMRDIYGLNILKNQKKNGAHLFIYSLQ